MGGVIEAGKEVMDRRGKGSGCLTGGSMQGQRRSEGGGRGGVKRGGSR